MVAFYKDINTYSPTSKPDVSDVDAIMQSVKNLILTRPGERLFNVEYGINSEALLFELMDDSVGLKLLNEISEKIVIYEPRVDLDFGKSQVVGNYDDNRIDISLFFTIQGFDGELFRVTESIR